MVRKEMSTSSTAESEKLATGALIEQLEKNGDRMKYKKIKGAGPATGWVSVKSQGKDLCSPVAAEEGGQAAEALTKVIAGEYSAGQALDAFKELKDKKTMGAGALLTTIPDLYLKGQQSKAAVEAAEEAVAHFKSMKDTVGLATAQSGLASAYFHEEQYEKAREAASAALSTFEDIGDVEAQASVMHILIGINLVCSQREDARKLAKDATKLFRITKDVKGQASALMLEAEVYVECSRLDAAAAAAKEAATLFEQTGDKKQEAAALILLAFADLRNEKGESIEAAEKAAGLYKELGDKEEEAGAMYAVANAHLSAMSIKQRRCLLPSKENTSGAIAASKAAFEMFVSQGNRDGQQAAMMVLQNALTVNGLEGMADTSRSTDDLMAEIEKAKINEKKVEKDGLFNRTKFTWREATADYHYVLVWEHAVENLGMRKGGYKAIMMGAGERSAALPMYHSLKGFFNQATTDQGPLMIHFSSMSNSWIHGHSIVNLVSVVGVMVTCKVNTFVFIQTHETPPDADEWQKQVRQIPISPTSLAVIRTARLENPSLVCGHISLDLPTWNNNRAEVIQSLPDVIQCEESELMYHKGSAIVPALIQKQIDSGCDFVKTAKIRENMM